MVHDRGRNEGGQEDVLGQGSEEQEGNGSTDLRRVLRENDLSHGRWHGPLRHGCQMAKFDPFLSLDCSRVESVGRQSNFAA